MVFFDEVSPEWAVSLGSLGGGGCHAYLSLRYVLKEPTLFFRFERNARI